MTKLVMLIGLLGITLCSVAGPVAADAVAGANLATNPSMEDGADGAPAGWRFWGWAPEGEPRTARGEWDRTVAHTGSASLKVINEGPKDIGTWCNRQSDGFISVEPGKVYTVSAWMMVESVDTRPSTAFRCGFCSIGADGKPEYFPAETRKQIEPAEAAFTEAGVWRRLAVAAKAPEGATHIGMDIDLIGRGVAWIDDVAVTEGYDIAAFGGKAPAPGVSITQGLDADPPTADAPLSVVVHISNPFVAREFTLECEIVDYFFRPSVFGQALQLAADEVREVVVDLDAPTRARLFAIREQSGANSGRIVVTLKTGDEVVATAMRGYSFKNRVREYPALPPLPPTTERIDDLFGEQKLVDVINCADPNDPHAYIEGGRGMGSKTTGAVPNEDWKNLYREQLPSFTSIETILGRQFRVTHGWGWFGYRFNRQGLKPGAAYVAVLEYPEDTGRTYTVFNTGISISLVGGYGFHTGRTLGDHWTRTLNSEYTDYPLSGKVERWYSVFHLGDTTWAPGDPWQPAATRAQSADGFWFIVGGVGPSQDPLASGAAVSTIKLYEISDMTALFPKVVEPPLELGRREMFVTAESDGLTKYLTDEQAQAKWAQVRLYDARFMGLSGISPNGKTDLKPLLKVNQEEQLGLAIFPRWMIERDFLARIGVPPEALAKNAQGDEAALGMAYVLTQVPDILHPATLRDALRLITEELGPRLADPAFSGLMLYRHYGTSIPVSFSDYALALYQKEAGVSIPGDDGASRRAWLLENQKNEYYQWWYSKERAFLLAVRDHLQALRPDLELYYFPWHSDDDYPFACGRLRYSGFPQMDKVYVPGTNILLVPGFTVPPEKWTPEQQKDPFLARSYYRETIAPELQGKITIEDVLYGRYKDMPEFWGAPRSGELPHLLYPNQMDLVAMLTEPGGMYAHRVGYNPRLFKQDKGLVYWAPVRHRFTADNPGLLELFRTGEGSAVAVHMPYNEETSHLNVPSIHGAHGVEHGGPFCMMEEVLAMAHSDPTYIMESMWEPLKRGFPQYARAFAQAYRALPAVPSTVLTDAVTPADGAIVVRSYETDYGHYLAVINRAFDYTERTVTLAFKPAASAVDRVVNLGTEEDVPFKQAADGRIEIELTPPTMSLTSLLVVDRTPRAVVRDVIVSPATFSPNGDGRHDTAAVTGRTVVQVTAGRWTAEVRNAAGATVRRFQGDVPGVEFTWDGTDEAGARCPDGAYDIRFTVSAFGDIAYSRQVFVDTTPPQAKAILDADGLSVPVNNLAVTGAMTGLSPGDALYLRQKGVDDRIVPVDADGVFSIPVEALDLGTNTLSLMVMDRAGNMTAPRELTVQFALNMNEPIGFDFGAGPIMEGYSAMRNETFYSDQRGYGWITYGNVWKGDRGIGDHLLRDYCSGKEDREWAIRLPNGSYTVKIVMVDMQFDHFAPDIYLEGRKLFESASIKAGQPLWAELETEVTDGLLNCEFRNPGTLPYFALTGIVIGMK